MKFKRLFSIILSVALLASFSATVLAAGSGTGDAVYENTTELVEGLTLIDEVSYDSLDGRVQSYKLVLSKDASVYPTVWATDSIMSDMNIEDVVAMAESEGKQVVAAVNSDFYNMANNTPLGAVIEDGILRSSPAGENILGFSREEGAFLIRENGLEITLTVEDKTPIQINHYNKPLNSNGGIFLFGSDFAPEEGMDLTGGWAVSLRIDEGEMRIGGELLVTVEDIITEPGEEAHVEEGHLIMTSSMKYFEKAYEELEVGDSAVLALTPVDERLAKAEWATGCGDVLVENGQLTEDWDKTLYNYHPRTAFGMKDDGTMVFYIVDGRMPTHSIGARLSEIAHDLMDMDCTTVVNLDGGGSTALELMIPGYAAPGLINRPSNGGIRSCSTYILFITDNEDKTPAGLYLERNGGYLLAGASKPIYWISFDKSLHAIEAPEDVIAESSGLGSVENGIYTAGSTAGVDTVTLRSPSLSIEGKGTVHIVSDVDEVVLRNSDTARVPAFLDLEHGSELQLELTLYKYGKLVDYDWTQVEVSISENVGYVNDAGLVSITGEPGEEGEIILTVGGLTLTEKVSTAISFDDVKGHWARGFIETLHREGVVNGTGNRSFSPSSGIRRGDFVLMLWRALGSEAAENACTFTDVPEDAYYAGALAWAQEKGIAAGYDDGTFNPDGTLSREQAFTLLYRALYEAGEDEPSDEAAAGFEDWEQVSDYAVPAASELITRGIVNGSAGRLNPKANITRAEMAKILCVSMYPVTEPAGDTILGETEQ